MKVTIDRFEGDYAIVELKDCSFCSIPKLLLPDAKEGDIVSINILHNETKHRKEHIDSLMNDLFN